MIQPRLRKFLLSRTVQFAALIALVVVFVYHRVNGFDFVSWDDNVHVYHNTYYPPFTLHSLARFWKYPYESLYIPVSYMAYETLSFFARTAGTNPSLTSCGEPVNPHAFHDTNVILHAINSILVFLLIRKAVKSDLPAAFGALLFALHPLQVETVAWISELRGLLCAFFGLSSMLVYQSRAETNKLVPSLRDGIALCLFALSLLAKPASVMIPLALLLWESLYHGKSFWRSSVLLLPWFVLSAVDVLVTRAVQPIMAANVVPFAERGIISLDTIGFYIQKVLWPLNLSIEYGRNPHHVINGHLEIYTIPVLLASVTICSFFIKKQKWVLPCMLTFFVFLLPNLGIIPFVYQFFSTVADRYVYLAMLGPCFALGFLIDEIKLPVLQKGAFCAATAALVLLSLRTEAQIVTWKNSETLFANAACINNHDWLPHSQLADIYYDEKEYLRAERQARLAFADGIDDWRCWQILGQAVQAQKRYREAVVDYDHALAQIPADYTARHCRAQCEVKLGEIKPAILDYRMAVKSAPAGSYADYELGVADGSVGDYAEAVTEFVKTIHLHPKYLSGYYYLAMTFRKCGRPDLAAKVAKLALAIDPHYAAVFPYLSVAAAQSAPLPH
jgi:Flp pilus assembly protein TadD